MARRPSYKQALSSLGPRVLSAIILIPLCLYIIYWGPPYSLIFGALVTIGIFVEWILLCQKNTLPLIRKYVFIIVGSLYLILAVVWLLQTLSFSDGWTLIFWILFLVWSTDISAFFGGRFLQGPKLAPSISPNKTWSGFIVGMILGTAVAYEASFWLFPGIFTLWGIVILVFIAQMGDLLESQAKRLSHVKDSSGLIPGHGGLLDRLDSLLAVAFALLVWQIIYNL